MWIIYCVGVSPVYSNSFATFKDHLLMHVSSSYKTSMNLFLIINSVLISIFFLAYIYLYIYGVVC